MEITFDKINLSDIGLYGLITTALFFILRQYLSTSVSEKVKIGFSKELKEFETNQQRTSTISVQHRELERNAIIEFHSLCSAQIFKLFSPVNGTENELPQKYLNKYNEINEFLTQGPFSVSTIHLLTTNDAVIRSSNHLMTSLMQHTRECEQKLMQVLLAYEFQRQENMKGMEKSMDEIIRLESNISTSIVKMDEYVTQMGKEMNPVIMNYREVVKSHLLA